MHKKLKIWRSICLRHYKYLFVLEHQGKEGELSRTDQKGHWTPCSAVWALSDKLVTEDELVAWQLHCWLSIWKRVRLEYLGDLSNNADHKSWGCACWMVLLRICYLESGGAGWRVEGKKGEGREIKIFHLYGSVHFGSHFSPTCLPHLQNTGNACFLLILF